MGALIKSKDRSERCGMLCCVDWKNASWELDLEMRRGREKKKERWIAERIKNSRSGIVYKYTPSAGLKPRFGAQTVSMYRASPLMLALMELA